MPDKGKVYLSGPISLGGKLAPAETARNVERFHRVAAKLETLGYEVVDPTRLEVEVDEDASPQAIWLAYMKACIKAMVDCEYICMLDGWEESKGSCVERNLAQELYMGHFTEGQWSDAR